MCWVFRTNWTELNAECISNMNVWNDRQMNNDDVFILYCQSAVSYRTQTSIKYPSLCIVYVFNTNLQIGHCTLYTLQCEQNFILNSHFIWELVINQIVNLSNVWSQKVKMSHIYFKQKLRCYRLRFFDACKCVLFIFFCVVIYK